MDSSHVGARSPTEIIGLLLLTALVVVALGYFAERSARRARERVGARAAVDCQRTDYPIVYEWGANINDGRPDCRVVIQEDSFTSDLTGVRFAAPIASIWRVAKASAGKAGIYWRVLCHAGAAEPRELTLAGEEGEVVARVLAHKAGVDLDVNLE